MKVSLVFAVSCAFVAGLMVAQGNLLEALICGAGAAINFGNLYTYLVILDSEKREIGE